MWEVIARSTLLVGGILMMSASIQDGISAWRKQFYAECYMFIVTALIGAGLMVASVLLTWYW